MKKRPCAVVPIVTPADKRFMANVALVRGQLDDVKRAVRASKTLDLVIVLRERLLALENVLEDLEQAARKLKESCKVP